MNSLSRQVEVEGKYRTKYAEIVKPDQRFLVSNYFIKYWVRKLGPTLAWLVIALQQACWRANDASCKISQPELAQEIGLTDRGIRKVLKTNHFRHWYIPEIQYHHGGIDPQTKAFYRDPNKYTVYLSPPPLTPEHLAGAYGYFQESCPGEECVTNIKSAIEHLLNLKSKEVLTLLETYAEETKLECETSLSLKEIVELATGFKPENLPPDQAIELEDQLADLETYLTQIGYTLCRQYFRLQWVPRLGPALSWLVMTLRADCYYNPESGELRDIHTWSKKDLAGRIGQSGENLRRLWMHQYAGHFFEIIENQKQKITLKVAMVREPLITETAIEFWSRQQRLRPPDNGVEYDSSFPEPHKSSDSSFPEPHKSSDSPFPEPHKSSDSLSDNHTKVPVASDNPTKVPHKKYFKQKVYTNNVIVGDNISSSEPEINQSSEEQNRSAPSSLEQLLIAAGLSGLGLTKLCSKTPPLDVQKVRAVILYAEANSLEPGYIYKHLETDAPVDELFLQLAALDDETLNFFRQATSELTGTNTLTPDIQTPIPDDLIDRYAHFAQAFTGAEPAIIKASLVHGKAFEFDEENFDPRPPILDPRSPKSDLDLLWDNILGQLRLQMTQETFNTWLRGTRLLEREGSLFTVSVKSDFARDWLENRLFTTIERTIVNLIKNEDDRPLPNIQIDFVVDGVV